jgi:hypothetical protein
MTFRHPGEGQDLRRLGELLLPEILAYAGMTA